MVCNYAVGGHTSNKDFQVWRQNHHADEIWMAKFIQQKMAYLYNNMMKVGVPLEPQHRLYSSAKDYNPGKQIGLINVALLELFLIKL